MNDKLYWEKFYKTFKVNEPSSFAIEINNRYAPLKSLLELGCGNGRDSFFFAKHGTKVVGVDLSSNLKSSKNFTFIQSDVNDFIKNYKCDYAIVYTRFFLHSLSNTSIFKLLNWTKGLFVAEFRAEEDKPILYKKHYRNLINGEWILSQMISKGFEILSYQKSNNLAIMKNENPMIIRIIGVKHDKQSI